MTPRPILIVTDLSVANDGTRKGVSRELALSSISFSVPASTVVLIVGGSAAGKTSLMNAINPNDSLHFRKTSVDYALDATVATATDTSNLPPRLGPNLAILKDGFQLENLDHWQMHRMIRDAESTLIASTEIRRLKDWRDAFDQVLLLSDGKIIIEGTPQTFRSAIRSIDLTQFSDDDAKVLRNWSDAGA